jgi:hypothetical protein
MGQELKIVLAGLVAQARVFLLRLSNLACQVGDLAPVNFLDPECSNSAREVIAFSIGGSGTCRYTLKPNEVCVILHQANQFLQRFASMEQLRTQKIKPILRLSPFANQLPNNCIFKLRTHGYYGNPTSAEVKRLRQLQPNLHPVWPICELMWLFKLGHYLSPQYCSQAGYGVITYFGRTLKCYLF